MKKRQIKNPYRTLSQEAVKAPGKPKAQPSAESAKGGDMRVRSGK